MQMTQQCTAYPGPLSAPSCAQARTVLNLDLDSVINWGNDWLVTFNQKKTHLLSLFRSRSPHLSTLAMNSIPLQELADTRLLGLDLTSNLSWNKYIRSIAKRASQRIGCLYRARQYLPPTVMLYLYKSTIRPVMEYCCHIWTGAPTCHLSLLDGHDLASSLESLSLHRSVASLSLFYRYYNGRCSKGLSLVVPPNRTFGRTTRFSAHSHPYTVSVPKANTRRYSSSFFPRTALLWNSLPVSCFPATYNLSQFKRNINSHLSTF